MLLEREQELDLLTALLADVSNAGGRVVVIRGEAGIGKSALVQAFGKRADALGRWYLGYCDDLGTPQPFAPFWDLASETPHIAEALRQQDRHRVFEAVYELLNETELPGVVVLEDTHWSDDATLDAIRYVGRRIARANGLLILTYRTGEVSVDHPLRTVVGDLPSELVVRVEPQALSRSAVEEIIAGRDLDADDVMDATHGNPFFVTELATVGVEGVPSSVRDSVNARVNRLPPRRREMLKVLSVIRGHIDADFVARLTGATTEDVAEWERMELLVVARDRMSFRHDLIRRAVESSLTASEIVDFHRRALDSLSEDDDPARLVHHAEGAGDVGRFVPLALEAARQAAAVSSNREAAAHYRSLEPHIGAFSPETAAAVLLEWAVVEHYVGGAGAAELVDRALQVISAGSDDVLMAETLAVAVDVKRARGLFEEAHAHADEAIEILGERGPSSALAAALSAKSWLMIHRGFIGEAETLAGRAAEVARAAGATRAELDARGVLGVLAYVRGQVGGLRMLESVRDRARDLGLRVEEVRTLLHIGRVAIEIRDLVRASDYGQQARSGAARYELRALETEAILVLAEARLGGGDWAAAEDLVVDAIGRSPIGDIRFERILGLLGAREGRVDAESHLRRSWALAETSGEIDHLLESAAGLLEWMWINRRSDDGLLSRCSRLIEIGIDVEYPWPAGWLAFWVWKADGLPRIPDGLPPPWANLMSGRVNEAEQFWRKRGYPYERALSLAQGNIEQRLLAIELLAEMGATAPASRLRRDLRAEGVNVPRGRSEAARSNVAGLTGRQYEVLQLLAEGLTNPEIADRIFVSIRTVENHVSAVISKLGAANRSEAVEVAARRGLLISHK